MRVGGLKIVAGDTRVSILMTVYNSALYLAEAIESVLEQRTSCPWELVIVDDGSQDLSLSIAKAYRARFSARVKVLQHPGGANCGISASRNLALRHASGSTIAFLDSDDVWLPHHLTTLTALLQRHPEVAAVYANAERWVHFSQPFDAVASPRAWWGSNYLPPLLPEGERGGVLSPGTLLQWFLRDEAKVPCICSMVVRTEAARAVGGFVNDFRGLYDDQAFHAKISLRYRMYAETSCVARYRQHGTSCCATEGKSSVVRQAERARFLSFVGHYAKLARSEELSAACHESLLVQV